ncbi:unnamed protein product [Acanthosepion pharaonis]|uniref:Uncharacterized protein n=1 Tax=Acanthosepion pharaonis TaxID=158019 RepID=A0A812AP47_ACAPH|nr:unnamed protein product [Sepia pharaonis]
MDSEVKSQLITGCLSEKIRQKGLMNSDMSLHDLINYTRTTEDDSVAPTNNATEDNNTAIATIPPNKKSRRRTSARPSNYPRQYQCRNCNGNYPRGGTDVLPCTSYPTTGNKSSPLTDQSTPVDRIENDQRNPRSSGSDTELNKIPTEPPDVQRLADSGTTINALSEADFQTFETSTPHLRPTKTVISGFGVKETTPALGWFNIRLEFMGTACQADIHVIKSPEKPIISWETCKRLGLLSAHKLSINHILIWHKSLPPPLNFWTTMQTTSMA